MSGGPFLSTADQIQHCIDKGITFIRCTTSDASYCLEQQYNYFKLRAYRKNFTKNIKTNQYIHLDFGDLLELSSIDTQLQSILLRMSLQIEYYAKVDVLHRMQINGIDAYKIVTDYIQSLSQSNQDILWADISKHSNSIYSSNLIQTYFPIPKDYTSVPIWVIFELLSFGQFIHLYKYCAQELKDNNLLNQTYLMHTIKNIRNAAAHNSCLLNNIFEPINHRFQVNFALAQALAKDIPISKNTRSKILSRVQPYQIIAALYCYYSLVPNHLWDTNLLSSLHNVKDVMVHSQVCQPNRAVQTLFTIFSTIIDTWFPLV